MFRSRGIQNLYLITMQKSGSQWLKLLINDKIIRQKTGLMMYPQKRYEWGEFMNKFPRRTFIPGLYMSIGLYEEIHQHPKSKTICVVRDPRNIVVSWYYSMLETHSLTGKVPKYRRILGDLSKSDGLHYCIEELGVKFAEMRSWLPLRNEQNVFFVKFEDITRSPGEFVNTLSNFLNCELSKGEQDILIQRYSKSEMRKRDVQKRTQDEKSHYRIRSSHYKDHFTAEHHSHFTSVNGNLLQALGYE